MIKFLHQKQLEKKLSPGKIVIYYSFTQIVMGVLLIGLISFYVYSYWQTNYGPKIYQRSYIVNDKSLLK